MGGGALMTPILIFFFNFNPSTAIGTDILHGAIFKSFGAVRHRRLGTVRARLGTWMLLGSAPSSLAGVWTATYLTDRYGDTVDSAQARVLGFTLLFGALAFAGMGFGLACLVRSQEGASPIVNVVVLPMTFLSGGFGPRTQLPEALQTVADVLPLTYFIDLVGAIYLDGEQLWEQPRSLVPVAVWGAAGLLVASRRFAWQPREG